MDGIRHARCTLEGVRRFNRPEGLNLSLAPRVPEGERRYRDAPDLRSRRGDVRTGGPGPARAWRGRGRGHGGRGRTRGSGGSPAAAPARPGALHPPTPPQGGLTMLRRFAVYRVLRIAGVAVPAILAYRWLLLRERLGRPAPPATWERVHDRVARGLPHLGVPPMGSLVHVRHNGAVRAE